MVSFWWLVWYEQRKSNNIGLYLYFDAYKYLENSISCIGSWERQSPLEQKKKEWRNYFFIGTFLVGGYLFMQILY